MLILMKQVSDDVRVMSKPADRDLVVQCKIGNRWKTMKTINEMSDDYAYTNAMRAAKDFALIP